MLKLSPYLRFAGNCREAMEFYHECLGGELKILSVGESPMVSQMPPEMKNKVMHAKLEKDGMVIMASDMMGAGKLVNGNSVSLSITGTGEEEIKRYFSKLSQGGSAIKPLAKAFFGLYGDFTDKFGIGWMFQADMPK